MDRIRKTLILALTLPLIGAVAVGCNTGTEEPDAPRNDSAADTNSGTDTGGDTSGNTNASAARPPDEIDPSRFPDLPDGAEAAVPANFPSDLPVYPGSVPAQGRGAKDEGGDIAGVQLLTNDSPDQAYDYYHDQLEGSGWGVMTTNEEDVQKSISVEKDGCKAIFMFVPSDSGSGTDIYTVSNCEEP
jgi:hypothetical protein